MRAVLMLVAVLLCVQPLRARADEAVVTERPIPQTSAVVPPPTAEEADDLYRSGRARLGGGIALLAIGVLGWAASTAGTVVSIVGWVRDDGTLKSTGQWLSIGGSIGEVGGLAGGIPLVISGVHRMREARRMRFGLAPAPNGGAVVVGASF